MIKAAADHDKLYRFQSLSVEASDQTVSLYVVDLIGVINFCPVLSSKPINWAAECRRLQLQRERIYGQWRNQKISDLPR
jgi:hypothetical protein